MKTKRIITIIVIMSILIAIVVIPSGVAAESWAVVPHNLRSDMMIHQKINIHFDDEIISGDKIHVIEIQESFNAKWKRISILEDTWEEVNARPESSEGWIYNPSLDRKSYDDEYDIQILNDFFKEETYERLSFIVYIYDVDIPFGYDFDFYDIDSTVISSYTKPVDTNDFVFDNQLGRLFFKNTEGTTDIYVHIEETTPWVESSFNSRNIKVYYNSDVMSKENIEFTWERKEFQEQFEQSSIGIGWIRTSDQAPPEYELIESIVTDPFIGPIIGPKTRNDIYVFDTVKITISSNGLPDGYRIAGPGFKIINMTNKIEDEHIVQLDVEATFLDIDNQYLGKRWIATDLKSSRVCIAGDAYTPPVILLTEPKMPIPPAIPGMMFTGYWQTEPGYTKYFPDSLLMYINNGDSIQPLPGTYTPIYAISSAVNQIKYDLGERGTTSDQTLFNIGSPDYEEPVEPTVIPNNGYVFLGWEMSTNLTTEELIVYEAVYKVVPIMTQKSTTTATLPTPTSRTFTTIKTTKTTPTQMTITTKTPRTRETSTAVVIATPTTSLTALIQNRQNVSTSSKNSTGRINGLLISNLN